MKSTQLAERNQNMAIFDQLEAKACRASQEVESGC